MTGASEPAQRRTTRAIWAKIAIAIAILVGVVVIGSVIFVVWAMVKGEQQSHDRADQLATAFRSTKPRTSEAAIRRALGEPSLVAHENFRGRASHCLVYRVLLPASELVPYRFCFVARRLVSKSRSWDNVPND
jgi:hypothetical protein